MMIEDQYRYQYQYKMIIKHSFIAAESRKCGKPELWNMICGSIKLITNARHPYGQYFQFADTIFGIFNVKALQICVINSMRPSIFLDTKYIITCVYACAFWIFGRLVCKLSSRFFSQTILHSLIIRRKKKKNAKQVCRNRCFVQIHSQLNKWFRISHKWDGL